MTKFLIKKIGHTSNYVLDHTSLEMGPHELDTPPNVPTIPSLFFALVRKRGGK
jgi:hypothetical protein